MREYLSIFLPISAFVAFLAVVLSPSSPASALEIFDRDEESKIKSGIEIRFGLPLDKETPVEDIERNKLIKYTVDVINRRLSSIDIGNYDILKGNNTSANYIDFRIVIEQKDNSQLVVDLATSVSYLELYMYDEKKNKHEDLVEAIGGKIHEDMKLLYNYDDPPVPYILSRIDDFNQKYIVDTGIGIDSGSYTSTLTLRFNSKGAAIICSITKENIEKRIAFVIDGKVLAVPKIYEPVCGGSAILSGGMKKNLVEIYAITLKYPPLPKKLYVIEMKPVP